MRCRVEVRGLGPTFCLSPLRDRARESPCGAADCWRVESAGSKWRLSTTRRFNAMRLGQTPRAAQGTRTPPPHGILIKLGNPKPSLSRCETSGGPLPRQNHVYNKETAKCGVCRCLLRSPLRIKC